MHHPLQSKAPLVAFAQVCFVVSLVVPALVGCGANDGKIPVSGVVKLGSEPLVGATVGFIGNDGGQIAHAITDATGQFNIRATPGINKVIVNKSPDPNEMPAGDAIEDESTSMLAGVEVGTAAQKVKQNFIVDPKFASPLTSGLEFDVKPAMDKVELVVTGP
jgi:hypothetical protein